MRRKPLCILALLALLLTSSSIWYVFISRASGRGKPAGLFPVVVNGDYGYINGAGKIVIAPKYQSAGEFKEGLALVIPKEKPKNACFIDVNGKVVIELPPNISHSIDAFSDGMASFMIVKPSDSVCVYIDRSGRISIKPIFPFAYEFSN